jgi:hypothetical protein
MVSFVAIKTTLFITISIYFRRLSFVKVTSFSKNQTNILTFKGNLIFHNDLLKVICKKIDLLKA